jgi:hypothetical protein
MTRTRAVQPKMTITPSLHKLWKSSRRKYDEVTLMAMAKERGLPCTKPVITNAIKYGSIHDLKLKEMINNYFTERIKQEAEMEEQAKETLNIAKAAKKK